MIGQVGGRVGEGIGAYTGAVLVGDIAAVTYDCRGVMVVPPQLVTPNKLSNKQGSRYV